MSDGSEKEAQLAAKGRLAALVISGVMVVWLLLQVVGPWLGLAGRFAILFDLLALVGLGIGLRMVWQLWRADLKN